MENNTILTDIYEWLSTAGMSQEGTTEQFQNVLEWLQEEIDELKEAVKEGNEEAQKDAIIDIIWIATNWGYMNNIPVSELNEKADRVSYSNWSKFCNTEAEAKRTVELYRLGEHPNKPGAKIETYYEKRNGFWVVKRVSDNKILKSLEFQEP